MFELLTSNEANDVWKHLCFQLKSSESGYVKRDENIEKFASSYKSEPAGKHVFIHESEEVFMIIFLSEFRRSKPDYECLKWIPVNCTNNPFANFYDKTSPANDYQLSSELYGKGKRRE